MKNFNIFKYNIKISKETSILKVLNLFLVGLQIFHSYKTYHLGNEFLEVFGKVFFEIQINNLSFLSDIFVIAAENKLHTIDSRLFKIAITLLKKLPFVLLLGFIILICIGYHLLESFDFNHYFTNSVIDYFLYLIVHYFEADKKDEWNVSKNFLFNLFQ